MGCTSSHVHDSQSPLAPSSYAEVAEKLARAGLETTQLILAFDFSSPNRCEASKPIFLLNLRMFCKALEGFQQDSSVLAYGFGDVHTQSHMVFSFKAKNQSCKDLLECWQRLVGIQERVTPCGRTSIAPMICEATRIVKTTGQHHTLVIVLESEIKQNSVDKIKHALEESSRCALSIVIVGIGMKKWEEDLLASNVTVIEFDDQAAEWKEPVISVKCAFVAEALRAIPHRYRWAKESGLLTAMPPAPTVVETSIVCNPPDQVHEEDPWYGLPSGWDAYWDPQHVCAVYINKTTKDTTHVRPVSATSSMTSSTASRTMMKGSKEKNMSRARKNKLHRTSNNHYIDELAFASQRESPRDFAGTPSTHTSATLYSRPSITTEESSLSSQISLQICVVERNVAKPSTGSLYHHG